MMRTAEPSPPGEERGIEIGRGRGGGEGLTLANAHARALTHTHTHTHERACVTLSFEYTPPRGSHPGTRPRAVTETHTCRQRRWSNTLTRGFFWFSHYMVLQAEAHGNAHTWGTRRREECTDT